MIKKIYFFGNPLVEKDQLPLLLVDKLKKKFPQVKFILTDPNENFPPKGEKDLIIIDTVIGITKPMTLDLDDFSSPKKTPVSPHDYDLLFHLLFLKKLKKIKTAKIIGLPVIGKKRNLSFLVKEISLLIFSLETNNLTNLR